MEQEKPKQAPAATIIDDTMRCEEVSEKLEELKAMLASRGPITDELFECEKEKDNFYQDMPPIFHHPMTAQLFRDAVQAHILEKCDLDDAYHPAESITRAGLAYWCRKAIDYLKPYYRQQLQWKDFENYFSSPDTRRAKAGRTTPLRTLMNRASEKDAARIDAFFKNKAKVNRLDQEIERKQEILKQLEERVKNHFNKI